MEGGRVNHTCERQRCATRVAAARTHLVLALNEPLVDDFYREIRRAQLSIRIPLPRVDNLRGEGRQCDAVGRA